MTRERESQDERHRARGMGASARRSGDAPREEPPGATEAGRALGLRGQRVGDLFEPNRRHASRWEAPLDEARPEGRVAPEELPRRKRDAE